MYPRSAGKVTGLSPEHLFRRCLVCNLPLEQVTAEDAAPLLSAGARDLPPVLWRCGRWEKAYWHGSHTRRMHATLRSALPDWLS